MRAERRPASFRTHAEDMRRLRRADRAAIWPFPVRFALPRFRTRCDDFDVVSALLQALRAFQCDALGAALEAFAEPWRYKSDLQSLLRRLGRSIASSLTRIASICSQSRTFNSSEARNASMSMALTCR